MAQKDFYRGEVHVFYAGRVDHEGGACVGGEVGYGAVRWNGELIAAGKVVVMF